MQRNTSSTPPCVRTPVTADAMLEWAEYLCANGRDGAVSQAVIDAFDTWCGDPDAPMRPRPWTTKVEMAFRALCWFSEHRHQGPLL